MREHCSQREFMFRSQFYAVIIRINSFMNVFNIHRRITLSRNMISVFHFACQS